MLDEQAAEQDPDADIGEGAEGEQPARRGDQLADLRVLQLDLRDERADRLVVDERDPELFVLGHDSEE